MSQFTSVSTGSVSLPAKVTQPHIEREGPPSPAKTSVCRPHARDYTRRGHSKMGKTWPVP